MNRKKPSRHRIVAALAVILLALGVVVGGTYFAKPAYADNEQQTETDGTGNNDGTTSGTDESDSDESGSDESSSDGQEKQQAPSDQGGNEQQDQQDTEEDDNATYGEAIYLNGQSGSDENNGMTADTAVKTFAKAKQIATENKSVKIIYVTGTVEVSGEISLEGTNAVLMRDPSFKDYLLHVSGSTATLKNITIDGNSSGGAAPNKSLIKVENQGVLNIQDGTFLQNNKLEIGASGYSAEGGAIYASKATVSMTGGTIQNNRASFGGGILVEWSTLNMSGGTITNNSAVNGTDASTNYSSTAMAAGGGIAALTTSGSNGTNGQTIINLSGGTISNNTSDETGGGISLGYQMVYDKENITLNMTGGTIDGNSAGSSGGGIFVQAGNTGANAVANISGGKITNNKLTGKKADGTSAVGNTAFGGGGIYVNGYNQAFHGSFDNGVLNLTNAIITENSAEYDGGGYASCPASETHIYITNGAAFYSNDANRYGDEIYVEGCTDKRIYGAHYGSPEYTVSPIMLGGVAYQWKFDNDFEAASDSNRTAVGDNGTEASYNQLSGKLDGDNNQVLALDTDQTGSGKTQRLAKVIISGNTSATRGGGIGSNGTVNIGESPEEVTSVKVTKAWKQSSEDYDIPESVRIGLYGKSTKAGADEEPEYFGFYEVSKASGWTATFENLPTIADDGGDYVYTVRELGTEGFVALSVTGSQSNGYTITNVTARGFEFTKKWDDSSNAKGIRPSTEAFGESLTLLANGEEAKDAYGDTYTPIVTDNGDNTYTVMYTNLPEIDADGKTIAYTVTEGTYDGYDKNDTVIKSGDTITNKLTAEPANDTPEETKKTTTTKTSVTKTGKVVSTGDTNNAALPIVIGIVAVAAVAGGVMMKRRAK